MNLIFPSLNPVEHLSMCRDFQRSKVYLWEDSLPFWAIGVRGERRCSLRYCRELVDAAAELYGLPKIKIRVPVSEGIEKSSAYYEDYYISLPKHFQRKDVALHEAAHYITGVLWSHAADHGKIFVRVYMHLLHELLGADITWMESYAKFHNVEFSNRKIYSPGCKVLDSSAYSKLEYKVQILK